MRKIIKKSSSTLGLIFPFRYYILQPTFDICYDAYGSAFGTCYYIFGSTFHGVVGTSAPFPGIIPPPSVRWALQNADILE